MSNTQFKEKTFVNDLLLDDQDHPFTKLETPLREDAFDLNDDEKIEIIELTSPNSKVKIFILSRVLYLTLNKSYTITNLYRLSGKSTPEIQVNILY